MNHHTPSIRTAVHARAGDALADCAATLGDEGGDWDAAARTLHDAIATCPDVHVVAYAKSLLADAFVRRGVGLANPRQARDFYIDAALAGIARGFLGIGRWYEGGDPQFRSGVPNHELAAHFFEQGVRAHHLPCAAALARLQLDGPLRSRDRTALMGVLREAAQRGDRRAGRLLARLERPRHDDAEPHCSAALRTAAA